jgi:hypothetical protein
MMEDPCVTIKLSKRRVDKKASAGAESMRRSMSANEFTAGRASTLGTRCSLRSSKEKIRTLRSSKEKKRTWWCSEDKMGGEDKDERRGTSGWEKIRTS